MKYCPITYEPISDEEDYSQPGLRSLSPQLKVLHPLDFTSAADLLGSRLKIKEGRFEEAGEKGTYILKPSSAYYPELPANEALTMSLAAKIGIEVPAHGLVYGKDENLTYFVKRLKLGKTAKDLTSFEEVADFILNPGLCSFPKVEAVVLLKRVLFSFLVGHSNYAVKNLSLVTLHQKTSLSPAYDLLNSTIVQTSELEMALPLKGKKNHFTRDDFLVYFGERCLGLNAKVITKMLREFKEALPLWTILINRSFLSEFMKREYQALIESRSQRLEI